jgi:putative thioredoxin
VRAFIERLAPSPERQAFDEGRRARAAGRLDEAEAALRRAMPSEDTGIAAEAALALAHVLVDAGRAAEAGAPLSAIDARSPLVDDADRLRELLDFIADAQARGGETAARGALAQSEADLEARYALAGGLAARAAWADSLEELIAIVGRSRKFRDDGARRAMLAVFAHLGADDDRTRDFRRRLQVVT